MSNLTTAQVADVLAAFVQDFVLDIPAKHIDGDYLIPLGELEYALEAPGHEWLEELTAAVNGE